MTYSRDPFLPGRAKNRLFEIYWCCYCGRNGMNHEDPDGNPWTFDHLFPLGYGGLDDLSNMVKSCWSCNSDKWGNLWEPIPNTLTAQGQYVSGWSITAQELLESLPTNRRKPKVFTAIDLDRRFRCRFIHREVSLDLVRWHDELEMPLEGFR
jgi:HNH endonuclease